MLRKAFPFAGAVALTFSSPVMAQVADVNTTGSFTTGICCFGAQATDTYGQSFNLSEAATLEGFSLFLTSRFGNANATDTFVGYVAGWNGSTISSILYSAPISYVPVQGTNSELAFDTSLSLAPGQYAVFLSAFSATGSNVYNMPYGADSIPGQFIYSNGDPANTSTFWNTNTVGNNDVWVKLDFELAPAGAVPEPATWAMLLMGFGAAGYALRRRRQVISQLT